MKNHIGIVFFSRKKTIAVILLFSVFWTCKGFAVSERPLVLPGSDRVYGEMFFASAYRHAIEGKIGESQKYLEEALVWDPYLVSYYLLEAYCFFLRGELSQASRNIELYLQVKPEDPFAQAFEDDIRRVIRFLKKGFSCGLEVELEISAPFHLWKTLGLGSFPPFFQRPSRPCRLGGFLTFCDTQTGKALIYKAQEKGWEKYFSGTTGGKIIRIIPLGSDRFLLIFVNGELVLSEKKGVRLEEIEHFSTEFDFISDAALAGGSSVLISDRIMGKINLVDIDTGETVFSWKPGESSGFEPVAVSVFGSLAAVADRRGRVFVLDILGRKQEAVFSLSQSPRSVEWLNSNSMLVLSEEGFLFEVSLAENEINRLSGTFPEAWFLFSFGDKGVFLTDTRLFRGSEIAARPSESFLALKFPEVQERPGNTGRSWIIEARLLHSREPIPVGTTVLQGVLDETLVDVSVMEQHLDTEITEIDSTDNLEKTGIKGGDVVIDCRDLPGEEKDLMRLGCFAVANGITFNIMADSSIPNILQTRLAEITGGKILSFKDELSSLGSGNRFILRVEVGSPPGIPGGDRSGGLFIMGRAGKMKIEGRFPLWSAYFPLQGE